SPDRLPSSHDSRERRLWKRACRNFAHRRARVRRRWIPRTSTRRRSDLAGARDSTRVASPAAETAIPVSAVPIPLDSAGLLPSNRRPMTDVRSRCAALLLAAAVFLGIGAAARAADEATPDTALNE